MHSLDQCTSDGVQSVFFDLGLTALKQRGEAAEVGGLGAVLKSLLELGVKEPNVPSPTGQNRKSQGGGKEAGGVCRAELTGGVEDQGMNWE